MIYLFGEYIVQQERKFILFSGKCDVLLYNCWVSTRLGHINFWPLEQKYFTKYNIFNIWL